MSSGPTSDSQLKQAEVVNLTSSGKRQSTLPRVARQVRAQALSRLAELMQHLFNNADDTLFEMADRSRNDDDQHMYFESMRQLRLFREGVGSTFLGEFEQMLMLAILRKGDEAYGVEVRRELEQRTGRSVSRGAFYTTLDRLQAKGYLGWTTRPVDGWRGGRPQRHFEVTEAGREQLRRSREALTSLWEGLESELVGP